MLVDVKPGWKRLAQVACCVPWFSYSGDANGSLDNTILPMDKDSSDIRISFAPADSRPSDVILTVGLILIIIT